METTENTQTVITPDVASQQTNFMQKQNQIAEIKYKIYAFVLTLIGIWFWWVLEAKMSEVDLLTTQVADTQDQIWLLDIKIRNDQTSKKIIWLAKESYDQVVNCINKRICDGVTTNKEINANLDNLRTFIWPINLKQIKWVSTKSWFLRQLMITYWRKMGIVFEKSNL
jgi:hypothetical protein